MSDLPRVRTPWVQQWRRIRYQLLPVLIFGSAVVTATWLWGRHFGLPLAVGEVHAVRVDAVTPVDGLLVKVADRLPDLFDAVQKDELVARLDSKPTLAMLATLEAELTRLRKQVTATEALTKQDQAARLHSEMTEVRRLTLDIEKLRLDILDRKQQIETDKIEVQRLEALAQATKTLVEKGIESQMNLVNIEKQRDLVKERIQSNEVALKEAEKQRDESQKRLGQFATTPMADLDSVLAPIREAITAQEARIKEVKVQIEALEIRAPISGTITAIHCWPGQNVRAGTPIITIAAAQGQYIVSFVRQEQRVTPVVGMKVDVRARTLPRQTSIAQIEEVGPQVEPIPSHQLRDPRVPEWGLPVRIAMPQGLQLRPGELVDVAIKSGPATPTK